MKIEAGKRYISNCGFITWPMHATQEKGETFFTAEYCPNQLTLKRVPANWTADGQFCGQSFDLKGRQDGPCTLVEEFIQDKGMPIHNNHKVEKCEFETTTNGGTRKYYTLINYRQHFPDEVVHRKAHESPDGYPLANVDYETAEEAEAAAVSWFENQIAAHFDDK